MSRPSWFSGHHHCVLDESDFVSSSGTEVGMGELFAIIVGSGAYLTVRNVSPFYRIIFAVTEGSRSVRSGDTLI